jgi:hypothetical protein
MSVSLYAQIQYPASCNGCSPRRLRWPASAALLHSRRRLPVAKRSGELLARTRCQRHEVQRVLPLETTLASGARCTTCGVVFAPCCMLSLTDRCRTFIGIRTTPNGGAMLAMLDGLSLADERGLGSHGMTVNLEVGRKMSPTLDRAI